MRGGVAFASALVAFWLALGGLVAMCFGYAVVEVVCVELAAVVLALITTGLLIADSRRLRCDHQIDCSDTWGGPL